MHIAIDRINGYEKVLTEIYQQYRTELFAHALQFVKCKMDSEEIVQDVFIKIWWRKERIEMLEDISSYLFVAVKNQSINYLAKKTNDRSKLSRYREDMITLYNRDGGTYSLNEYEAIIGQAVDQLPPQQKAVYRMVREGQWKRKQIAIELKLSPITVKSHMAKALKNVRKYLLKRMAA